MHHKVRAASLSCMLVAGLLLGVLGLGSDKATAVTWVVEIVDSDGITGRNPSLALNSSGYPFIGYWDESEYALKLAHWDGALWQIETVDATGHAGLSPSLKIDSQGYPHLSYFDGNYYSLKYARWNGSDWNLETVDSSAKVGTYSSLALDASDQPHISYYDETNGNLKYARWNGTAWLIETPDAPSVDVGRFNSLALNASGYPHISYLDQTYADLKYVWWDGAAWHVQTVLGTHCDGYTSIALDDSGRPQIGYGRQPGVKFANWTGSSWQFSSPDPVPYYRIVGVSLALDALGNPRIVYYSYHYNTLRYTRWDGSTWRAESIDARGIDPSFAIDSGGYPHVAYYDSQQYDLKYAKGAATNPPSSPAKPSGPVTGLVGILYDYTTSATDPDGDQVKYVFDWGDSTTNVTVYVPSGTPVAQSHSWSNAGTYQVRAKAIDFFQGSSGWSNPLSVKIYATPSPPGPPEVLYAYRGVRQITLQWFAPPDDGASPITNYTIYRGSTSGGEVFINETGNVLTYIDTGLGNGQDLFYKVAAKNGVGEGAQSSEVYARTYDLPGPPTGVTPMAGNGEIWLSWYAPADNGGTPVTNYTIYRGTSPGGETFLKEIGNVLMYHDVGLTNGQAYSYYVRAKTAVGEGAPSLEVTSTPATTPGPPRNLTAVEGFNNVALSWDPPADNGGSPIANYKILRGTSPSLESLLAQIGPVLAFTDSGVTGGLTYYYVVVAKNSLGDSSWSNEVSASPYTIPGQPRLLAATAGRNQVDLEWQAPLTDGGRPVTNYSVYRGSSPGAGTLLVRLSNILSFNDSGLPDRQTYYYSVTASNIAGESARTNEVMGTTLGLPGLPRNLVITTPSGQVKLTWNPPVDDGGTLITNYNIYRGTTPAGGTLLVTLGCVFEYVDVNAAQGQRYYYQVSAVNLVGEGSRTGEVTVVAPAPPGPPTSLNTAILNGRIKLTWSPPVDDGGAPITGYSVLRGVTSGGESLLVTLGNVLDYVDTTASPGQRYYYQVSATNVLGIGPPSVEVVMTAPTVPSAPLSLAAVAGDGQIALSWSPPATDGGMPVTNYEVFRGTASMGETFLVELGPVLGYTDTFVANGQMYYYMVAAKNYLGQGNMSSEVSAIPATIPGPPIGLWSMAGESQVSLFWSPPADNGGLPITGYAIYRGFVSGGETLLVRIGDVLEYTDTGLTNGLTHYYAVTASTPAGEGPPSSETSAKPITRPTEPLSLVTTVHDQTIELSWLPPYSDGGSMITNYGVYGGTAPGEAILLAWNDESTTSYEDIGLQNGVTYYYKVTARNIVGEGAPSQGASATPGSPPTPVRALTATAGTGRITLSWMPPTDDGGFPIKNYTVYRGEDAISLAKLAELGNVLTYADSGLTNGHAYFYMVKAKNQRGESGYDVVVSAIPATIPSEPLNLTIAVGQNQVTLNWMSPSSGGWSAVTHYRVYRRVGDSAESLLATLGNVLTYTDSGLTGGQAYSYKISAGNSMGEGPKSVEVSAVLPSPAEKSMLSEPIVQGLVVGFIILLAIVLGLVFLALRLMRKMRGDEEGEAEVKEEEELEDLVGDLEELEEPRESG